MINHDFQLKLQAFLDGELPDWEAAEVQARLTADPEAQALVAELRNTKAAFIGHEAEVRLPETREFFWSRIQREIDRQERVAPATQKTSWFAWVQSHLIPVSGVALLSCLLGMLLIHSDGGSGQTGEMELASDDMGTYTFRDQQQRLTMVWFYDRADDSEFTKTPPLASIQSE